MGVNSFVPLGEGELLNLYWDPIILGQAITVETHYD